MKNKQKTLFMAYLTVGLIVLNVSLYFFHFLITKVLGATPETSLIILIPTIMVTMPAFIAGFRVSHEKITTQNNTSISDKAQPKIKFAMMPASLFLLVGAIIILTYLSILFIRDQFIGIGIILFSLALAGAIFFTSKLEKVYV